MNHGRRSSGAQRVFDLTPVEDVSEFLSSIKGVAAHLEDDISIFEVVDWVLYLLHIRLYGMIDKTVAGNDAIEGRGSTRVVGRHRR